MFYGKLVLATFSIVLVVGYAFGQAGTTCPDPVAACPVDERLPIAEIGSVQEARRFVRELRDAAALPDRVRLAAMVRYPFTIYDNGQAVRTYAGPDDLLGDFENVFTPSVLRAMGDAEYGLLFINDQGAMIGDGEAWFSGGPNGIRMTAINPGVRDEGEAGALRGEPMDVRRLQQMLNAKGYDAGRADGVMGPRTRQAMEAYERDMGALDGFDGIVAEQGPGFDCTRAGSPTEFAICGSADLAAFDRRLSALFAARRSAGNDPEIIRQREWLRERNACGAHEECIGEAYRNRLKELSQQRGAD